MAELFIIETDVNGVEFEVAFTRDEITGCTVKGVDVWRILDAEVQETIENRVWKWLEGIDENTDTVG